ncbi:MAG TPA: hypothetical protein VGN48_04085 [Pedococcus sp.]|jgi:hypothetical protein|nr:hypothetical protein [Pedococcus sp.]
MSELETQLVELLHEPALRSVEPENLIEGARRYAVRVRRARLAATAVTLAAVLGVGGAVVSGAFRDRALTPAHPVQRLHDPIPFMTGASWVGTSKVTDKAGHTFVLAVHEAITTPATSKPSPTSPGKQSVTGPTLAGSYTITNISDRSYDLGTPVVLFAYWKVPVGFCDRYDHSVSLTGLPVPRVSGGKELCPMAMGDSTLATTPQTLMTNQGVRVAVTSRTIGLGQNYPLQLNGSDAAQAVRIMSEPPAAWGAFDDELSTTQGHPIASKGLPPR